MNAQEISKRRSRIVDLLQERGLLRVTEAARMLDVSHETIRQDFLYLEQQGLLKKVYGGAKLSQSEIPDNIQLRKTAHYAEKLAIARTALQLISPKDLTIGLDSGSTVALLASQLSILPARTIFTNSWTSMSALLDSGHELYFSGGRLLQSDLSFHGNIALNAFRDIRMDLCFLGSSGVWNHSGICTANYQELDVKRQYLCQSAKKIVLMDSSKFAVSSFVEVAKWSEIDILITDNRIADEMRERLSRETNVILAETEP